MACLRAAAGRTRALRPGSDLFRSIIPIGDIFANVHFFRIEGRFAAVGRIAAQGFVGVLRVSWCSIITICAILCRARGTEYSVLSTQYSVLLDLRLFLTRCYNGAAEKSSR